MVDDQFTLRVSNIFRVCGTSSQTISSFPSFIIIWNTYVGIVRNDDRREGWRRKRNRRMFSVDNRSSITELQCVSVYLWNCCSWIKRFLAKKCSFFTWTQVTLLYDIRHKMVNGRQVVIEYTKENNKKKLKRDYFKSISSLMSRTVVVRKYFMYVVFI